MRASGTTFQVPSAAAAARGEELRPNHRPATATITASAHTQRNRDRSHSEKAKDEDADGA